MATSRAMLLPDRVQRVQTIKRPARTTRRWTRCLLCALPLAGFVALQLVFAAFIVEEVQTPRPAAAALPAQPTLQPEAAAEPHELTPATEPSLPGQFAAVGSLQAEEDGVAADAEATADGARSAPSQHHSTKRKKKRMVVVKRRVNATRELQWDFAPPTVDGEQTELRSCVGRGTYGTVLNASYPGGTAVLKMPLMRSWGFKFYRIELSVLLALQGGGSRGGGAMAAEPPQDGERNIVRLLGNVSVSVERLLRLNASAPQWSCLNTTDLLVSPNDQVRALPALLLEPLPRGSLFHWLAALAAPDADSPLPPTLPKDVQRRLFKERLALARLPGAPFRDAMAPHSAWELLLGLAHGMRAMHARRVVHRDLTEPGKNVQLKRDGRGLTTALVDFSQSEQCAPPTRGEGGGGGGGGGGARAIDTYAFGNVLYFACYGRVRRTVPWTKHSCDLPRQGLLELRARHAADQPAGPADAAATFNRCATALQPQLDALMRYCWQPALDAADALLAKPDAGRDGGGRASAAERLPASAGGNHSWGVVVEQLLAMRAMRKPLLRFM